MKSVNRWVVVLLGLMSGCPSNESPPGEGGVARDTTTAQGDGSSSEGVTTASGATGSSSSSDRGSTSAEMPGSTSEAPSDANESESAGAATGCDDPGLSQANRVLIATAIDALFVDKDLTAIDRFWAEPYLQHNPIAASGVAAFRAIMTSFVPAAGFTYDRLRTFAECDLVVVQGQYSGSGVIFDMFRIGDGSIIEHWDSDANQASDPSGPTEVVDTTLTAQNRQLVLDFMEHVLIESNLDDVATFHAAGYVEHHESDAIGSAAFLDYVGAEAIAYTRVHHVIADGNFVFTLSEGTANGDPHAFYDLFRLESGALVEHWDSRREVPDSTASGLSIF